MDVTWVALPCQFFVSSLSIPCHFFVTSLSLPLKNCHFFVNSLSLPKKDFNDYFHASPSIIPPPKPIRRTSGRRAKVTPPKAKTRWSMIPSARAAAMSEAVKAE